MQDLHKKPTFNFLFFCLENTKNFPFSCVYPGDTQPGERKKKLMTTMAQRFNGLTFNDTFFVSEAIAYILTVLLISGHSRIVSHNCCSLSLSLF